MHGHQAARLDPRQPYLDIAGSLVILMAAVNKHQIGLAMRPIHRLAVTMYLGMARIAPKSSRPEYCLFAFEATKRAALFLDIDGKEAQISASLHKGKP